MQYITTTELRTKTSELVQTLKKGCSVLLIHRSKVIATISPKKEVKPFNLRVISEVK